MTDILLESLRVVVVGITLFVLFQVRPGHDIYGVEGWGSVIFGFTLVFFGTLIDVTDNFPELNRFVFIGDTPVQAFLEKVVAYLFGFIFIAIGIWRWLPKVVAHQKMITAHLEETRDEVKVLQGLLPICASCKKIRDDKGYWNRIESYITDHSEATFSHGVCPACTKKLYPEVAEQIAAEKA